MDHKNQMDFIKAVIQGLRDVKNGKIIELDFFKTKLRYRQAQDERKRGNRYYQI